MFNSFYLLLRFFCFSFWATVVFVQALEFGILYGMVWWYQREGGVVWPLFLQRLRARVCMRARVCAGVGPLQKHINFYIHILISCCCFFLEVLSLEPATSWFWNLHVSLVGERCQSAFDLLLVRAAAFSLFFLFSLLPGPFYFICSPFGLGEKDWELDMSGLGRGGSGGEREDRDAMGDTIRYREGRTGEDIVMRSKRERVSYYPSVHPPTSGEDRPPALRSEPYCTAQERVRRAQSTARYARMDAWMHGITKHHH